MFRKLQWRLTFFYTFLLIMVLVITNVSVYKLLEASNNQRLSDEISELLTTIEGSEWLAENNSETEDAAEEDYIEGVLESFRIEDEQNTQESEDNEVQGEENKEDDQTVEDPKDEDHSEDKEDIEDTEDKEEEAEDKEMDEKEEDELEEEEDEKDKEESRNSGPYKLLSKSYIKAASSTEIRIGEVEIYVPIALQSYPYFTIHDVDGRLLDYKRPSISIGNLLYKYDQVLEIGTRPELIEIDEGVYYIMAKTPILIEGVTYGTATVGKNVSLAFETLEQLGKVMMIFIAVGSLIAFFIGYALSGRVLRPIRDAYTLKEEFIGNASHEFRTPISIILLSMDLLKREKDKLSDLGQETLMDIEDEAYKMRELVDKLIFVARNDAKNLVIEEERVDMTELLMNNVSNYQKMAKEKNVTIAMDKTLPYYVDGDKKMLDSVISTLLDNAVKYNKVDGSVDIHLTEKQSKGKDMIELTVEDSGIGVPSQDLDKIFERFHRQDSSRSKKMEGYGLGLSIARDIILAHNGHIRAQSQEGLYTKMIVELPKSIDRE